MDDTGALGHSKVSPLDGALNLLLKLDGGVHVHWRDLQKKKVDGAGTRGVLYHEHDHGKGLQACRKDAGMLNATPAVCSTS